MPRYSMNINYAPSKWERADQGIAAAIAQYQAQQDRDREEQNQIAAQGGVAVGAPPTSPIARVGRYLRRKITGQPDATEPPAVASATSSSPAPIALQMPAVQQGQGAWSETPNTAPSAPAWNEQPSPLTPRRGFPSQPTTISDALASTTTRFAGMGPADNQPGEQTPVVRAGAGRAQPAVPVNTAPSTGATADAFAYTIRDRRGQQYRIDPLRASRLAAAGKGLEAEAVYGAKEREEKATQQEQIQALVDAGMSPAVARAKVLNNVVKYDEEYGQRRGAMSQSDRMAVQDRVDRRQRQAQQFALDLEKLRQQGRTSSREFQEKSIQLREWAQQDANDRALLAADEAAAGRAESAVGRLQTNPMVQATPEGQQQTKAAQDAATAAAARAASSRERVAGKSRTGRGSAAKATIDQDAYDRARAKTNPNTGRPYTDAEISQYYQIAPGVRRH